MSRGRRFFEEGLNRLVFRDAVVAVGIAVYRVSLEGEEEDRVPENDRALGALRVAGARSTLVVNNDGAVDALARALRAAGLPVEVSSPEAAGLDPVSLTRHRAVVLENVAAGRLGSSGMEGLRDFVLERGGGLLVTGGRASFGVGGYFRSPLDDLLPVSMEMRQESRKQAIALAISMDRSGSMAMPVGHGLTKMDLANLGAAAAIELLSPLDQVGVIAVDSAHHVIQELTAVTDKGALVSRVKRIESMGGGIFTYTALLAAGRMLEGAKPVNRHVILFADAADSEEQENVPQLLERFAQMGITVSVIALGTEADTDANFLKDVAARGGGEIYFTTDPSELPRLFAQDTMRAARSTFVEEPTSTTALPDLFGLGEIPASRFPDLDGYNLTYPRSGAVAGAVTNDDYAAPVFAFHYRGLGRAAAFTGQIGGSYGRSVLAWEGFAPFFVTAVRWLSGQEEPEDFFASVRREGKDAVISLELDPSAAAAPETGAIAARVRSPDGGIREVVLDRVGENRFEARHPLSTEGIALGTVRLGDGRFLSLPPIALPYSPEFERPPDPRFGERTLQTIARESGGEWATTASALFRGPRQGRAVRALSRELALAALLLLLAEIAGRRLHLWGDLRVPRPVKHLARSLSSSLARAIPRRAPRPVPGEPVSEPGAPAGETVRTPSAATPARPIEAPSLGSALDRAKRTARKKLGR